MRRGRRLAPPPQGPGRQGGKLRLPSPDHRHGTACQKDNKLTPMPDDPLHQPPLEGRQRTTPKRAERPMVRQVPRRPSPTPPPLPPACAPAARARTTRPSHTPGAAPSAAAAAPTATSGARRPQTARKTPPSRAHQIADRLRQRPLPSPILHMRRQQTRSRAIPAQRRR